MGQSEHPSAMHGVRLALFGFAATVGLSVAWAGDVNSTVSIDIPPQNLATALTSLARQADLQILFAPELVAGKQAAAISGSYSGLTALMQLLSGTRLDFRVNGRDTIVVRSADQTGLRPTSQVVAATAPRANSPAPTESAAGEIDEIVVTATLIRGVAPVGAPVVSLGAQAIRDSGLSSTTELLQTLPQVLNLGANGSYSNTSASGSQTNQTAASGVNLRGLGTQSTLTLVNGHRSAPSGTNGQLFDASSIPVAAIGRIEVVADGASATYGTDAVGGVVNIILRKNFDGAESRLSYGIADGTNSWNFSQAFGTGWGTGNLIGVFEHSKSDELLTSDRAEFYDTDLRAFGVPLVVLAFSDNPANIRVTSGTIAGIACSAASPCYFGVPAGQNGGNLTGAALQTTPGAVANNYAGVNIRNLWEGTTALPRQQRDSLVLTGEQDLNDWLRLSSEAFYTKRNFHVQTAAATANLSIPNSNPYSPCNLAKSNRPSYCGQLATSALTIPYFFGRELGPGVSDGYSENATATVGLDARLARGWHADFAYTYSENEDSRLTNNGLNTNAVNPDATTSPNFANNFNPFIGDGSVSASNQALVDKIRAYQLSQVRYNLNDVTLRFDGPLFQLPAGPVRLAVGTEFRSDEIKRTTVSTSGGAALNANSPVTVKIGGQRHITSLYAEVFVPVLDNGVQKLNLSLAGRSEKYSDFGSTSNPKFGLSFTPWSGVKLNGSYGTSYRAPALTELQPTLGSATNYGAVLTSAGNNATGTVLVIGGGNPSLQPESAKTWTTGINWQPVSAAGLDLYANYFNIVYTDRIGTPGSNNNQVLVNPDLASLVLNRAPITQAIFDQWINYINANGLTLQTNGACTPLPGCLVGIIDARVINAGRLETSGVDLNVSYPWSTPWGTFTTAASYTRTLHWKVGLTPNAALSERVNSNNDAYPLRNRGRLQLGWKRSSWQINSFVNYVGSYSNSTLTIPEKVATFTTVDVSGSYAFSGASAALQGVRLGVTARNVFDEDPPLVKFLGQTYTRFDPQNATALGRQVTLQLTKQW